MPGEILEGTVDKSSGPHYDEDLNELNTGSEDVEVEENEDAEEEEEVDSDAVASDEEEEESEEIEEEEEEPVKIPFSRPSIKEIKAKYPEFFSDFPDVKDSIFREAQFTKLFPTVEDAQEAFTDNEAFGVLSEAALSGDSTPIIDSLEKTDPKALAAFAGSFLPALYKKNQEIYSTIVTPLFESFFRHVYKTGDENMKNSAINLAEEFFGKDDGEASATGKKTLSRITQITEEQKQAKLASEAQNATAFRSAASYVSDEVGKSMRVLVGKDFDPNKVFTPTVRRMLIEDIVKRIDRQLTSDKAHETVMGARWKRARSSGFSSDEKAKIISTYLARAKSLISPVREKVRREAMGKTEKDTERTSEKIRKTVSPKETNGGRSNGRPAGPAKDYSKMSDLDILNS